MGENYFIEGLPIKNKYKVGTVITGFILLIINHNITVLSSIFNYPYRDIVTLVLLGIIVVASIGSVLAEGIIIGLALFSVMSAMYDLAVVDISQLRKNIIIIGIIILVFATLFGKISLFRIFRGQLGLN